jgi:murein DD-endopeptidase MepM/ murein hydrolase activator NlpD
MSASHRWCRSVHRILPRAILACLFSAAFAALPASAGETYVLQQGETLFRVSRKYDVPVDVLQRFNGITNPQALKVGARIRIPESYRVQKGDTLYGIARRYSVELEEILRLNGITDRELLKVGRSLYLPEGAASRDTAAGRGGAVQGTAHSRAGGHSGGPDTEATGVRQDPAGSAPLWPLPGDREALQGRILGTVIRGQAGEPVVSVSAGRVIWAGPYRGFSRVVLIEGENGYTYVYAGNEETLVRVGDFVRQGSPIGRLGKNVHEGTPQLYFLVYRNGTPVDPSQAPRG